MVKVRGPLFSNQASGSMARGTIQYRTTKKGAQVILPGAGKKTTNRAPTANQAAHQDQFKGIASDWRALAPETKTYWSDRASALDLANGWSAYVSYRMAEALDPARLLTTPTGEPITDGRGRRLFI